MGGMAMYGLVMLMADFATGGAILLAIWHCLRSIEL